MNAMATASPPTRESLVRVAHALPAAPRILARLGLLLADTNSEMDEIVDLLKRDASLTARILRVSNSVAYATESPVASPEEALMRIGFTEVYRIAGFAMAAQISSQQLSLYGMTAAQFRENALLTALVMENLGGAAGLDARDAYTIGLLRSVGKVALDRLARDTASREHYQSERDGPLAAWEIATVGISNVDTAAIVLEDWNFPVVALQAIRSHYQPADAVPEAHLLHLAAGAAERCGHGWPGEWAYWQTPEDSLAAVGVTEADVEAATRAALESFGPVRAAVG